MEQIDQRTFSCGGCGKTYKWKAELAGKRVKCKCGHVMTVPEAQASDEPDLDAMYELADAGKHSSHPAAETVGLRCPSCQGNLPVGEIVCPTCGFNLRSGAKAAAKPAVAAGGPTSPMLGYAPTRKADPNLDAFAGNQVTELWLPIGLIVFGFLVSILQWTHFSKYTVSVTQALPIVSIGLIIDMVMIALGCLVAIKLIDVAFGAPAAAALKITAIAIAPGALGSIVGYMFHSSLGIWVGSLLSILLYCGLFHFLFDFDATEVLLLGGIIYVVRMWVGAIILALIMSSLMPGIGGFGAGSGAAPQLNVDIAAEEQLEHAGITEARPWLSDGDGRLFGRMGHVESVKVLDDLQSMGCKDKDMFVQKSGSQAGTLIAKMSDSKQRDKIKQWGAALQKQYPDYVASVEVGNTYVRIEF